ASPVSCPAARARARPARHPPAFPPRPSSDLGEPITHVVTADGTGTLQVGTIPRFQGPNGVTEMWADAAGGARYLMVATSLGAMVDRKSTRLNSSHVKRSYAGFCLKKKKIRAC